jgi:hypothetical protein
MRNYGRDFVGRSHQVAVQLGVPQGLKPIVFKALFSMVEVVP